MSFGWGRSIVLAAVFGGLLLYKLKKNEQFWYGIIEVLFAITSISYSVFFYSRNHEWYYTDVDEGFKRVAFFYLLVRGINNIDDGLSKPFLLEEQIKPIAKRVAAYMSKTVKIFDDN